MNPNVNPASAADTDIIDLEEHAKAGKPPPKGRRYRYRVGKEPFVTDQEKITGREVLTSAGKLPVESWLLSLKRGKAVVKIGLDEVVDLTEPGVERFMVVPKDQTEGEAPSPRRHFSLPAEDTDGLEALGLTWETVREGKALWLLIHDHPVPQGYAVEKVTAAVRISANYPTEQLDMVYFFPPVARVDGKKIGATEATQNIDGRVFQRWSRHYTPQNPWVPGEFSVLTHLALVREWLEREFLKAA